MFLYAIIIPIGLLVLWIIYLRWTLGVCKSPNRLDGKLVLITGANTGIGYETAKELARRGARVVLACRSLERGRNALQSLQEAVPSGCFELRLLDLASLQSVRRFCASFTGAYKKLDILINNAGVAGAAYTLTDDGFELHMACNHFGHFLLTLLLLDMLKAGAPSRIINVSGSIGKFGSIDLDNLNFERNYGPVKAYCASKIANVMFTKELHRRYHQLGICSFALHPGVVKTELFRSSSIWMRLNALVMSKVGVFKSAWEGAQTSIYLAADESVARYSGEFFSDCRLAPLWVNRQALDARCNQQLWHLSERAVSRAAHHALPHELN